MVLGTGVVGEALAAVEAVVVSMLVASAVVVI